MFQFLVALCLILPFVAEAAGLEEVGVVGGVLAVAAAITRVMALPQVEDVIEAAKAVCYR